VVLVPSASVATRGLGDKVNPEIFMSSLAVLLQVDGVGDPCAAVRLCCVLTPTPESSAFHSSYIFRAHSSSLKTGYASTSMGLAAAAEAAATSPPDEEICLISSSTSSKLSKNRKPYCLHLVSYRGRRQLLRTESTAREVDRRHWSC
jgi:hypothetical protein